MRCNIKNKQLPAKCPKCGKKLKSDQCVCGHQVCQEETNEEKAWTRRMTAWMRRISYGETISFGW